MIPRDTIVKILEESVQAPSGENAQPWRFGIRGEEIHVFNIPERDQSPYNFRQRASYVADGTVIENISLVAPAMGYYAAIELFPDKTNPDLVAIVRLKYNPDAASSRETSLYPYIAARVTNRKPYRKEPLATHEVHELLAAAESLVPGADMSGVRLVLTEKRQEIDELGMIGAMNEQLVFETKALHEFLFSHINWTDEENEQKKIGFDIKTLELPPPARAGFNVFKHWGAARVMKPLGLPKSIQKQNGVGYAAASAVGIIAARGSRNEDFVQIGRATQRVWLTATKLGLSLQPMTGILFFMQRILSDVTEPFSGEQVERIKAAFGRICKIFGAEGDTIPMMFRVGRAEAPTAQSLKLPPEIIDLA